MNERVLNVMREKIKKQEKAGHEKITYEEIYLHVPPHLRDTRAGKTHKIPQKKVYTKEYIIIP